MSSDKISKSANTDAEGNFRFESLAPGKYSVNVQVKVMQETGGYYYTSSQQPQIEITGGEQEQVFTLPSSRLTVTVVDSSGKQLNDVPVRISTSTPNRSISQPERRSKTDGTAVYEDLQDGEYNLTARQAESGRGTAKVSVPKDGEAQVTLKLEKGQGGTVVSTVLNMEGQPVKEAWCKLNGQNGPYDHGATRDASGVMTISDVPAGTYKVEVSYWSHSTAEREIEVKLGETVRIDDVLYPAGALVWTVQDSNSNPVANAQCTLTPADPNSIEKVRTGATIGNGTWTVRGMAAGNYVATAKLPDGKTVTANLAITAGAMTNQTSKP